jgi:putative transcriptional regulator
MNPRKNRPDASGRYACLSQAEFSRRYAVSPRSLREWEQGRRRPESAVRAYLTVIDRNPEAVEKALMNMS